LIKFAKVIGKVDDKVGDEVEQFNAESLANFAKVGIEVNYEEQPTSANFNEVGNEVGASKYKLNKTGLVIKKINLPLYPQKSLKKKKRLKTVLGFRTLFVFINQYMRY